MSHQAKGKQRETIEVEDDDARLQRIQRVLEKLNTGAPAAAPDIESIMTGVNASSGPGQPVNEGSLNELLARVQAFLPQIEASNAALGEMDLRSLDIENTDGDDKVIEMNLGLGVFEDRSGREGSHSESGSDEDSSEDDGVEQDSDESSSNTDSSDDSSSSEEESSSLDSDDSGALNQGRKLAPLPKRALLARTIRPLPGRTSRPEIVLAETTAEN
ncbi:hypothetical protein DFH08DRAFT_845661 [Mycena albidolilacea]|uniref:Uncharacterized protein n=1 Tax=Mycena albidolilacea TaxID=1033008 RepID=A0AAD7EYG6_9AGAR|nr:hypothetical protein DFH08DRAFT_845661 [Mycena albidolilacea]